MALAQRVPIIAHRDHFNLIGFIQGKIPKSYQMKSRGKLADMDLDDRDENDVKNDKEMLDVDILEKYKKMGCPVDELIDAIKDQFNKEPEEAERRLTMLFTLLEGMKYDVHQL